MDAFHFFTKLDQTLLLGLRATSIEDLLTGVRSVPDSAIYFHTHRFLFQHHFLSPEPPNDFAYWVTDVLGDDILGERLWSVDTVQFGAIGDLRAKIIAILETHVTEGGRRTECRSGEEFHFMASRIFVLPTGLAARDLDEFAHHLSKLSINSIYFHMFDAKLRLKNGANDFSRWFRHVGNEALANEAQRLDPYSYTLDGLRQQIIALVRRYDRH
jgi:hypothetical protein